MDDISKLKEELDQLRIYKACTELALRQIYNMFDPPLIGTPGIKNEIVKLRETIESFNKNQDNGTSNLEGKNTD